MIRCFARGALARLGVVAGVLVFGAGAASAASPTDALQTLDANLAALRAQFASTELGADGVSPCLQLGTLNTSMEDYIAVAEGIRDQLTDPLSVTLEDLTSLDDLSTTTQAIAQEAVRLSVALRSGQLAGGELTIGTQSFGMVEYEAAMAATLRLSTDIGLMADRILEMADRILVMSDNIGLMADRIVATQRLQRDNLALIEQAMLTTQSNMVAFNASISTVGYNLTLANLKLDTQALQANLSTPDGLTPVNMSTVLLALQAQASALLVKVDGAADQVLGNSDVMSHHIDGETLTMLGDLSGMHKALAVSLQAYASAVAQLAPLTEAPVLQDATAATLALARDIGAMSDRIMKMTDKIIIEADNVGVMAGRIVETETIQKSNLQMTLQNLQTAQNTMITVIASAGL